MDKQETIRNKLFQYAGDQLVEQENNLSKWNSELCSIHTKCTNNVVITKKNVTQLQRRRQDKTKMNNKQTCYGCKNVMRNCLVHLNVKPYSLPVFFNFFKILKLSKLLHISAGGIAYIYITLFRNSSNVNTKIT